MSRKFKNRWASISTIALAVILVAASASAQDKADMVAKMPADVLGFGVAKNLESLEVHVREFLGPLGAAEQLPSLREALMTDAGLPPVFDFAGNWGIVVLTPKQAGDDPTAAMLFSVKNWDEAAAKLGDADENGIYSPPDADFVLMRYRDYVAGSDDKADLLALKAAKGQYALSPEAAKILKESEVFVHINVKAVLAAYKNEIEEAKEKAKEQFEAMKAMAEMEKAAGGDAPGAAPGPPMKLLQIFPGAIDILIEGLYQVESYDAGGNIGKNGVTVREAITLDKSGSIARALGAFKPLKEMMPALPALDSFVAAGWINVDMKKLLAEYLALIEYADAKMGLTEALGEAYIEEMKTSMKNSSGLLGNALSVVISVPPAEEKQGIIAVTEVLEVTDEEAYRKEMARGTAAAQKMMAEVFGNLGVGAEAPKMTFTQKPDAEKIAGASVDHMKIDIEMPVPEGAPPAAKEQMEMMMKLIYGPEGLLMRTAIVDGKAIVTLGGPGEMARAIAAVKAQKPGLGNNAALKGLCGKLPKGYSSVGFLSIPGFAQVVPTMMQKMMLMMMPPDAEAPPAPKVEAPKLTSAIIAGLTVNGNVCRFDLHVPMAEILAGKEAVMGMMGVMMGGMGGPPMAPPPGDDDELLLP